MTEEEILKSLAYTYNEKVLYSPAFYPSDKSRGEVNVQHIKTDRQSNLKLDENNMAIRGYSGKLKRLVSYEYIVRVSCTQVDKFINGSGSGRIGEIKWEGPLQEWYRACADVISDASQEQEREDF